MQLDAEQALQFDLTPTSITAFMVGLENRAQTFQVQRQINDYQAEPMSAILPGATLSEFWRTISPVEQLLFVISGFVLVAGLLGMLTTILSTLNERRREIAVLRAIGARGRHVVMLIVLETLLVVTAGCALGVAMLYGLMAVARPIVARRFGVDLAVTWTRLHPAGYSRRSDRRRRPGCADSGIHCISPFDPGRPGPQGVGQP